MVLIDNPKTFSRCWVEAQPLPSIDSFYFFNFSVKNVCKCLKTLNVFFQVRQILISGIKVTPKNNLECGACLIVISTVLDSMLLVPTIYSSLKLLYKYVESCNQCFLAFRKASRPSISLKAFLRDLKQSKTIFWFFLKLLSKSEQGIFDILIAQGISPGSTGVCYYLF